MQQSPSPHRPVASDPRVGRDLRQSGQSASGWTIAFITVAGVLLSVAVVSPAAMGVLLKAGSVALAIVLCATGLGSWIAWGLRLDREPPRHFLLISAGLGLGAMALLTLGLGTVGILSRAVWIPALVLFAVSGIWRIRRSTRHFKSPTQIAPCECDAVPGSSDLKMRWLWLGIIGFGAMAVLAGAMPPGILWPAEGNGYDVLEYHLGAPREFFEAERIAYLPHNIYSNFPFNVEMLYLLSMILHGDAIGAVFTAKLLNVLLAALAVAGIWLCGREFGRGSGIVAGSLAASCPFLTYLCGVAYVENGMLLFSGLALTAVLRLEKAKGGATLKWAAAGGLLCGLACGCKYTAIPAVFAPWAIATVWIAFRSRPFRPGLPIAFVLATALSFAPWLVKNAIWTGNPVFPLARTVFPERAGIWNDDCAERWHEGHLPAPEDRPFGRRVTRLWHEIAWNKLFGPVILLGVVAGVTGACLARTRRRCVEHETAAGKAALGECSPGFCGMTPCWLMLLCGAGVWLIWTHLQGRFAVTLIVPAAVMAGRTWRLLGAGLPKAVAVTLLVAVLAFNTHTTRGFFTWNSVSLLSFDAFGRTDWMETGQWPGQEHVPRLNGLVASGGRVLMVGDARRYYLSKGVDYCVVFNRNPFAEAAGRLSADELIDWLRRQGYRHVYVDWSEMHRLRSTRYGFWTAVDAELFQRLCESGLRPVDSFSLSGRQWPYSTLFEVP
ncbi:MAG: hypothetical protein ABII12_09180 [Planctomycetota bacterium]